MHWDQAIILLALVTASGAALVNDRWLLVAVMWMNFSATVTLMASPMAVGVTDIVSATVLLWLGSKRDYIVASLFIVMVVLYPFAEQLGRVVLYDIVNLLAIVQCIVMGRGGFSGLLRCILSFVRDLRGINHIYSPYRGDYTNRGDKGSVGCNKERGIQK